MFIKENIMLAIAGLKSNKMRALLTMLGIIIGIASVIGIVSVGNAMTSSVTSSMSEMGSSNIMINVKERSTTTTSITNFNDQDKKDSKDNKDQDSGDKDAKRVGPNAGGEPQGSGPGGGRMPGGSGSPPGAGGMPGGSGMPGGGRSPGGGEMPGGGGPMMGGMGGRRSGSTAKDSDLISMQQINELVETYSDKIDAVSISETKGTGKAKDGTL